MTKSLHSSICLAEPESVLAAVPHLLGFHPKNSLVFVTVHGSPGSARVGMTVRIDLPNPTERARITESLVNGPIRREAPDAVILVVVGGEQAEGTSTRKNGGDEQPPDTPPHAELIDFLRKRLAESEIGIAQALWTSEIRHGTVWYSYDGGSSGRITDPKASPLAAALAVSGAVTFQSREELAELVAPESVETLARRSARLTALHDETEHEHLTDRSRERGMSTVFGAIRRTAGGTALTEDDLLRVLVAVSDHRVRDMVMASALTEWAAAAEQLWLALVRKAPEPEVADVAALLAFSAYLRGDGALASIALERLEKCRPAHRLGTLLRRALDAGVPPSELAVIVQDTAEEARSMIGEDGL